MIAIGYKCVPVFWCVPVFLGTDIFAREVTLKCVSGTPPALFLLLEHMANFGFEIIQFHFLFHFLTKIF